MFSLKKYFFLCFLYSNKYPLIHQNKKKIFKGVYPTYPSQIPMGVPPLGQAWGWGVLWTPFHLVPHPVAPYQPFRKMHCYNNPKINYTTIYQLDGRHPRPSQLEKVTDRFRWARMNTRNSYEYQIFLKRDQVRFKINEFST